MPELLCIQYHSNLSAWNTSSNLFREEPTPWSRREMIDLVKLLVMVLLPLVTWMVSEMYRRCKYLAAASVSQLLITV